MHSTLHNVHYLLNIMFAYVVTMRFLYKTFNLLETNRYLEHTIVKLLKCRGRKKSCNYHSLHVISHLIHPGKSDNTARTAVIPLISYRRLMFALIPARDRCLSFALIGRWWPLDYLHRMTIPILTFQYYSIILARHEEGFDCAGSQPSSFRRISPFYGESGWPYRLAYISPAVPWARWTFGGCSLGVSRGFPYTIERYLALEQRIGNVGYRPFHISISCQLHAV